MAIKDQPKPLMPHATATWLVDNTALSFEQIAEFCGLHILEVQAMADDLAGSKYTGRDPVHAGELTQGEIELGQAIGERVGGAIAGEKHLPTLASDIPTAVQSRAQDKT